jgi:hypothetical protein
MGKFKGDQLGDAEWLIQTVLTQRYEPDSASSEGGHIAMFK